MLCNYSGSFLIERETVNSYVNNGLIFPIFSGIKFPIWQSCVKIPGLETMLKMKEWFMIRELHAQDFNILKYPIKQYSIEKLHEGLFIAALIFREIQEMGFTGKWTIVTYFDWKIRPDQGIQAVYRYENKTRSTSSSWLVGIPESRKIDSKMLKLYCFNMILGYSKMGTLNLPWVLISKSSATWMRFFT